MKPFFAFLLLIATTPAIAASRPADLDAWFANELLPYVREQLSSHPRFRGEALRFVVFENGNPQAASNALVLSLRDRLRDAIADMPGVRIAWQPDNPHYVRHSGPGGVDCTKTDVHYLVGLELMPLGQDRALLELRAVDLEDRSIVPGFGKSWQGQLTSRQAREYRRMELDPTFRGEREVPYDESQGDLLAAHLAHDLGCSLLRQTDAEYVIAGSANAAASDPVDSMVELVGNNLAQYGSLQFAASGESANSTIAGKAHRIDDDLYQYWVTVQPKDAGSELKALTASAYVRLPDQFVMAEVVAGSARVALRSEPGFLASLKVVQLDESAVCRNRRVDGASRLNRYPYFELGECYALAVRSTDDAVVFFLHHQLSNGLVRLTDSSCARSSSARIIKARQQAQFVLPPDVLSSASWSEGRQWALDPDRDTFYALATTDSKAARELSRHVRQLPVRCGASVRPGLEGAGLRQWMEDLSLLIDERGPTIHWQTIRVKNIY